MQKEEWMGFSIPVTPAPDKLSWTIPALLQDTDSMLLHLVLQALKERKRTNQRTTKTALRAAFLTHYEVV